MKISRDTQLFLRKILVYFAIMLAVALIQTSFLAVLAPFGAVPDLVLAVSLGAGYFCSPTVGAVFGVFSGTVAYALGDTGLALLPLVYGAVGFASGVLVQKIFKGKFAVWCIYSAGGALVKGVYSVLCCMMFSGEFRLWTVLLKTLLPEFIGTVIICAALYIPIKELCKLL